MSGILQEGTLFGQLNQKAKKVEETPLFFAGAGNPIQNPTG